jgi:hypothetical protein
MTDEELKQLESKALEYLEEIFQDNDSLEKRIIKIESKLAEISISLNALKTLVIREPNE